MLFIPAGRIVNLNFINFFRKTITNRNRYPLPVLSGLDPVTVLPFIFFVLDIIQIAKNVRPSHFIEITDPGQILRLMNSNNQFANSLEVVSKP